MGRNEPMPDGSHDLLLQTVEGRIRSALRRKADWIDIVLEGGPDRVTVIVADDGERVPVAEVNRWNERVANRMDGLRIRLISPPGLGTRARIVVPR
jgi:phosphatidate phosphatase APP1